MIGIFNFIDMLIISTIPQLNTYVATVATDLLFFCKNIS